MTDDLTTTDQPKKPGILSAVAYFAAVALVVAAVYVISPPESGPPEPAPVEVALETTTTTTVPAPTTTEAVEVATPDYVQSEEPVADAAEAILPSVVHIQTQSGLGAGVIYDEDGLIVTAAHVVDDQDTVQIRFSDGEQVTGTVVGRATEVDVAVIEVERNGLPAAIFTSVKPRVGQLAVAVGSPWGLQSTVTAGIISAVDQTNCRTPETCASMIQTDAAINPGNSGGALVDRLGRVVGINVSIFSQSGANDGVGFAVPSPTVLQYAESIVSGQPLQTAFLGVSGGPIQGEGPAGALVAEVFEGTAAEEAGIQPNDLIIFFDGIRVQSQGDLAAQIRSHLPGDEVELVLIRDGEEITLTVVLGVRSAELS